ncbi:unnamed protein product [Darwinula stevensoni]|uniref:Uncharacterized protein n=1 Tax=Darwinula stevensoni TaxID=69355 RepID=A0A7R8WZC7_9CRUS|nr:unnamed protein product [Darwinula stevensoni]CAG0880009.1 unnamed protein product [Darwinula stevensoni]
MFVSSESEPRDPGDSGVSAFLAASASRPASSWIQGCYTISPGNSGLSSNNVNSVRRFRRADAFPSSSRSLVVSFRVVAGSRAIGERRRRRKGLGRLEKAQGEGTFSRFLVFSDEIAYLLDRSSSLPISSEDRNRRARLGGGRQLGSRQFGSGIGNDSSSTGNSTGFSIEQLLTDPPVILATTVALLMVTLMFPLLAIFLGFSMAGSQDSSANKDEGGGGTPAEGGMSSGTGEGDFIAPAKRFIASVYN